MEVISSINSGSKWQTYLIDMESGLRSMVFSVVLRAYHRTDVHAAAALKNIGADFRK